MTKRKTRSKKDESSLKTKKNQAEAPQSPPKERKKPGRPPRDPKVPTTAQLPLVNGIDVRREMAKLYREARAGVMDATRASKLVWMLGELRRTIEVEDLERQLRELREAAVAQGLIAK